jgi:hypothetical protein
MGGKEGLKPCIEVRPSSCQALEIWRYPTTNHHDRDLCRTNMGCIAASSRTSVADVPLMHTRNFAHANELHSLDSTSDGPGRTEHSQRWFALHLNSGSLPACNTTRLSLLVQPVYSARSPSLFFFTAH